MFWVTPNIHINKMGTGKLDNFSVLSDLDKCICGGGELRVGAKLGEHGGSTLLFSIP